MFIPFCSVCECDSEAQGNLFITHLKFAKCKMWKLILLFLVLLSCKLVVVINDETNEKILYVYELVMIKVLNGILTF